MNRSEILSALDTEISRLQQARELLTAAPQLPSVTNPERRGPGRPKGSGSVTAKAPQKAAKRTMSTEGRARIAAAQKARWAKLHKAAKKTAAPATAAKKQAGQKQSSKIAKKAVTKTAAKKSAAKKSDAPRPEVATS